MSRSAALDDYKQAEYQKLGFTEYEASRLIEVPGLDVGSVRKVILQGCKLAIAYRIFRP